jgi:hypothetical protein
MKLHANAQTCPHCRSLIVSRVMDGQVAASVARDFRVSAKTVFPFSRPAKFGRYPNGKNQRAH